LLLLLPLLPLRTIIHPLNIIDGQEQRQHSPEAQITVILTPLSKLAK
jgi:hypothetical protein